MHVQFQQWVFVVNFDSPGVRFAFSQSIYSVNEGSGIAEVCIQLISGAIFVTADIPIEVSTLDGSAIGCKLSYYFIAKINDLLYFPQT